MPLKNFILSKSNQYNYYKDNAEELKKENEKIRNEQDKLKKENENLLKQQPEYNLEKGISVIIPSYKGENHIEPLLDSLEKQTLNPKYFELLFILNGPLDSTASILKEFMDKNKNFNVIITYISTPSESKARNIGINLANREYTTFIDDDDAISPNYLEKLLEYSRPNRVVMSNFIDIDEDTNEELESILVPFSNAKEKTIKNIFNVYFGLTLVNVAKSYPSITTKSQLFNTNLNNGIDVSYYARLNTKFDFEFYFIEKKDEAIYYRKIRSGSLSRQELSFQFNVKDRLAVMDDINSCLKNTNKKRDINYFKKIINAQSNFMIRYLEKYPDEKENVINEVKKHDLVYFPMKKLEDFKLD